MSNEINAIELTDEQLDVVAGGKGTTTTTFKTNLTQVLGLSADTNNVFFAENTGKNGGAGGAAEQNGASISGIVVLGSANIG